MVVIINKTELMTNLSKCRTGAAPTCQADMINDSYIAQGKVRISRSFLPKLTR